MAIFIGIINYSKFEEKWHNYRFTCERLKKELFFYKGKIDAYKNTDDPEGLFIQRVESITSDEHSQWITIEKTKKRPEPIG